MSGDHKIQAFELPGDNLADRFTVAIRFPDGYHALYGMSYGAAAVDTFIGELCDSFPYPGAYTLGEHLGEPVPVPEHLKPAIARRIAETLTQPKATS